MARLPGRCKAARAAGPRKSPESSAAAGRAEAGQELLSLQGTAGNLAVGELLARQGDAGAGAPSGAAGEDAARAVDSPAGPARPAAGGGQPLPVGVRIGMEARFGMDLGAVRLHTGKEAEHSALLLASKAFTIGTDIWLGRTAHPADTTLLSHELAHVVQQSRGPGPRGPAAMDGDAGMEAEAQRAGRSAAAGRIPEVGGAAPVGVQRQALTGEEINRELLRIEERLGESPVETNGPEPRSLHESLDPDDLTVPELREEILAIRSYLGAQQESSEETVWLEETLERLEAALKRRTSPGILAERIVGQLKAEQSQGPPGSGNELSVASAAFTVAFLAAVAENIPPNELERLTEEVYGSLKGYAEFAAGRDFGMVVGAADQVRDNVVALLQLVGLLAAAGPIAGFLAGRQISQLVFDPTGYLAEAGETLQQAQEIAGALVELLETMLGDPTFLTEHGAELGEIAGASAARWFTKDFMNRSTFDKGWTVGDILGRAIAEIALLFLGPGEWAVRGVTAVAQGARLTGRLAGAIRVAMERIPALARLMRAFARAPLEEAGAAGRGLETAEDVAQAGGKLAGGAEEAVGTGARLAEDVPTPPRAEAPTPAGVATGGTPTPAGKATPAKAPDAPAETLVATPAKAPDAPAETPVATPAKAPDAPAETPDVVPAPTPKTVAELRFEKASNELADLQARQADAKQLVQQLKDLQAKARRNWEQAFEEWKKAGPEAKVAADNKRYRAKVEHKWRTDELAEAEDTTAALSDDISAAKVKLEEALAGASTHQWYPAGWNKRPDARQLDAHAKALDAREAKFRQRAEEAEARREAKKAAADKGKITEVEGERAATRFMLENHPDLELVMGHKAATGFDQVYVRRAADGKVTEIVIVEAKGLGAKLGKTDTKGPQMSLGWVRATAAELAARGPAETRALGREILNALETGNVPVRGMVVESYGRGGARQVPIPGYRGQYRPPED